MERDAYDNARWTLAKLKVKIDACTQPPPFRGTKSPITDLINRPKDKPKHDSNPKPHDPKKRDERRNTPPGNGKQERRPGQERPTTDRRPAHERPANFPSTIKRPDTKTMVNGKAISSEQQQVLYDDIKK
jgi:hypothetical protein